jgi:hypothetical protein
VLEHLWSKFARLAQGVEDGGRLRGVAMRALYLNEGRSSSDHPATASHWRRIIEKILKRRRA